MARKYGNDPSQYQLRDIGRRVTKIEKAFDRLIKRHELFVSKIKKQVASLSAPADLEEE